MILIVFNDFANIRKKNGKNKLFYNKVDQEAHFIRLVRNSL